METDPNEAANFRMMLEMLDRNILQSTFDVPMVEVIAWDPKSSLIVAMNKTALGTNDITLRQAMQRSIFDLLPQIPQNRMARLLLKVRQRTKTEITFRLWFSAENGKSRLNRVVLRYIDEPKPTVVAFIQNITHHIQARKAATHAQEVLSTAIESLPDGFVLYDAHDRLVICNERYREIYRQSASAMREGTTFREILEYGLDRGQYANAIGREKQWLAERLSAHRVAALTVEQKLSTGEWLRIVERKTPDGGRVGLRIDITELKNNEAKLELNARTDHLTGLLNRRGLTEMLLKQTEDLKADERIAVLHVDLDKFKSINDAQGHEAGDFVLQHISQLLRKSALDPRCVARVGGDEFIVLIKSTWSNAEIIARGQDIISLVAVPFAYRDMLCNSGASIGIAFYDPKNTDGIDVALTDADIALNEAKLAGRGKCRLFEQKMRDGALQLIHLAQEIRAGIKAGEFEPFFQPQVDTQTGRILGFEALIRWRHPIRGLVPAFSFLPAAEKAGLMDALDNVVMDRSCAAAAEIAGWGLGSICISINMSMPQLRDPDILGRLLFYMDRHGISAQQLRIELLESTLLDDRSDIIIQNVHRLIAYGFLVELDDFGTGHAAIATLRKFAVSRIKIDRSLVKDIDTDEELQVITGAIINLADRLGIKALAEGVETQAEQDALQVLGCPVAQGYLHARPMALDQLRAWSQKFLNTKDGAAYPHMIA